MPQALKDLEDIKNFIARDNHNMATRVIETIFFFINNLTLFPVIGKTSNSIIWCREIVEPTFRYTIIYEFDGKDIYITAVFKYRNVKS